ncbi:9895_t:CDS:2 [Cetraspora pellucida]|uniref:9895_t:CDS:1 n=1 Tax=Cetraspora pellucida TaxID=1433469 RepID=A0ACA9MFU5_9GLOM|nr:9895_t:CDS:2 [Cetraspora pellucida]
MDYAENGDLTKYINNNKDKEHDWNFNRELIKQIVLGLAYIHQQNVIHRDLKSMNILLDKHFQVKISDFEIMAKCTKPFEGRDIDSIMIYVIRGGREIIPSDAPENIKSITQQFFVGELSENQELVQSQNGKKTDEQLYSSDNPLLVLETDDFADNSNSKKQTLFQAQLEIPPK